MPHAVPARISVLSVCEDFSISCEGLLSYQGRGKVVSGPDCSIREFHMRAAQTGGNVQ